MRRRQRQTGFPGLPTSFIDKLFIMIIVFLAIAILALILMSPIVKKKDIETKAEFIISMDWPVGDVDVDIWIRTPNGDLAYYHQKDQGFVSIERDDTGIVNDFIILDDGVVIVNPINHETVTFRGIEPGEYTVNIHLFRHGDFPQYNKVLPNPVPVVIQMQKINPKLIIFYQAKKLLITTKQELHLVKFTIDANGEITSVRTDLPESLTKLTNVRGFFNDGADLPAISPNDIEGEAEDEDED